MGGGDKHLALDGFIGSSDALGVLSSDRRKVILATFCEVGETKGSDFVVCLKFKGGSVSIFNPMIDVFGNVESRHPVVAMSRFLSRVACSDCDWEIVVLLSCSAQTQSVNALVVTTHGCLLLLCALT